jgi:hypothetical protein
MHLQTNREFTIGFNRRGDDFFVPGRLTFGGFYPVDGDIVSKEEALELLLAFRTEFLQSTSLVWKLPPRYFIPEVFEQQCNVAETFSTQKVDDVNQHIEVIFWNEHCMSRGNQKKKRQLVRMNVEYRTMTLGEVGMCYEVLRENRTSRGAFVSMSQEEIEHCLINWPSEYRLVCVCLGDEILATALTVDIASDVRYVLYWADNLKYRSNSPVVYLSNSLIEEARSHGIRILDLGTSSLDGILDDGLFRFKKNLGAKESIKSTYKIQFRTGDRRIFEKLLAE